jgi:N-acetylneuraminic acid mutarotase
VPRQEVAVVEAGGRVYVIGGILQDLSATGLVHRYDPVHDAWEEVAPLPRELHHVGAAALEGKLYAIGGLEQSFDGVRSCFSYDPDRNEWEDIAPLPTARGALGAAALGGRIYAAGGQRVGGTVREFAAFTPGPGGGVWEVLPEMPTARNHLAAGAAAGFFFAISGRSGATLRPQVERYDPSSRSWLLRSPIPTPRGGIALAALSGRFYVFGGEGNSAAQSGVFPQTEMYDPAADRWFTRLSMSVPRHGIGAASVGGAIYLPGGSEVQGFGVTAANTAYVPPEGDLETRTFIRGDSNSDGSADVSDPIAILFSLFSGGQVSCADAADVNDDGTIDVSDAIRLLALLFLAGEPPPEPWPVAGPDPTPDALGC